jgi:hypothetical protein
MVKKLFSDKDLERWSVVWGNPLIDGGILKGSLTTNKMTSPMRIGDGEDMVELEGGYMLLENQDYARLFSSTENRELLASLSPRGAHLLLWLMVKVIKKHDLIWIDRHQYMKDAGISRQETYMNAVSDLAISKVLSKAPKFTDMYFINPHVFFKGSRLMKYISLLDPNNIRFSKNLNKKLL